MSETRLTVLENGPYKLQGPLAVYDHEGNEVRGERGTVFLCRCGGSRTKPFCDGTHSRIGFKGAREAVERAERGG
jgi:CDGSH-type Zn-finger protein